jgi:hypothetical protein
MLFFISDRTNWWNIYACDLRDGLEQPHATPVTAPRAEEFGAPTWTLGTARYCSVGPHELVRGALDFPQTVLITSHS